MKYIITVVLLLAFAVPSWAEDDEPLVLHCVYESSVGNIKGATHTSTPSDSGLSVPVREKETFKITGEHIEHAYEIPTPIVDRTDVLIVGRFYNSEMLLIQKTYVFEKKADFSYSVLRSWIRESFGYIDYGTCTKF